MGPNMAPKYEFFFVCGSRRSERPFVGRSEMSRQCICVWGKRLLDGDVIFPLYLPSSFSDGGGPFLTQRNWTVVAGFGFFLGGEIEVGPPKTRADRVAIKFGAKCLAKLYHGRSTS